MLIGELSSRSGVSTRSLRYYEQHGLLASTRAANGYREYDDAAVERASTIHLLFGMGLARDVVVAVLGCSGAAAPASAHDDLRARLPGVLEDLDRRIGAMSHTREQIAAFVGNERAAEDVPRP